MAEPPYLQLIASFWEWSQQEINTWLRAFGNLKEVLAERDLLSEDTFKSSLRFSAFNILIAMLVDLPPKVVFAPKGVSMLMFAALFILYHDIGIRSFTKIDVYHCYVQDANANMFGICSVHHDILAIKQPLRLRNI